jgi:hypothetical protein
MSYSLLNHPTDSPIEDICRLVLEQAEEAHRHCWDYFGSWIDTKLLSKQSCWEPAYESMSVSGVLQITCMRNMLINAMITLVQWRQ